MKPYTSWFPSPYKTRQYSEMHCVWLSADFSSYTQLNSCHKCLLSQFVDCNLPFYSLNILKWVCRALFGIWPSIGCTESMLHTTALRHTSFSWIPPLSWMKLETVVCWKQKLPLRSLPSADTLTQGKHGIRDVYTMFNEWKKKCKHGNTFSPHELYFYMYC